MRLFVALPIPDELRDVAAACAGRLRAGPAGDGLRWSRPEGYHVTLAFLGEVAPQRRSEVTDVLDEAAARHAPIGLRSAGGGRFGRSVLWLGIEDSPDGAVAALGDDVQERLVAAQLPVQRQPVHPHVTLGRGGRRRRVDASLVAAVEVPPVSWRATSVELWSSRLGGGPARYAVEHTAPLHG